MIPENRRSTFPTQFLIDSSDSLLITYSYRFVYRSAYAPPPRLAIISHMLIPHEQDEVFPVLDSPSVLEIKESCCDKCSTFWKDYCQHLKPFSETNTNKRALFDWPLNHGDSAIPHLLSRHLIWRRPLLTKTIALWYVSGPSNAEK